MRVRRALVLAAGAGTRLWPLTRDRPKPMLPVAGRPLLEHLLALLHHHGVREVIINLHHRPEVIPGYFGDGARWGLRLRYSHEEQLLGSAGAAKRAAALLQGEPFFVVYGDVLTDADLTALAQVHEARRALLTIGLTRVDDPTRAGIVALDHDGRVQRFVEKPRPEEVFGDLANAGLYVADPAVLEYIPADQPCDFGHDLLPALVACGMPVFGAAVDGYVLDIGSPARYAAAQRAVAEGCVRLYRRPRRPSRRLLGALALVATIAGCALLEPAEPPEVSTPFAVQIRNLPTPTPALTSFPTQVVRRGTLVRSVVASGALAPTEQTPLVARVAGELAELKVRPGDIVKAGDIVGAVKVGEGQNARLQLEQQLVAARRRLSELRRTSPGAVGAVAEAEQRLSQARLRLAQARLAPTSQAAVEAERRLAEAQSKLAQLRAAPPNDAVVEAERRLFAARARLTEAQRKGPTDIVAEAEKRLLDARLRLAQARLTTQPSSLAEAEQKLDQARLRLLQVRAKPEDEGLAALEQSFQEAQLKLAEARAALAIDPTAEAQRKVDEARVWLLQAKGKPLDDGLAEAERRLSEAQIRLSQLRARNVDYEIQQAERDAGVAGGILEQARRRLDLLINEIGPGPDWTEPAKEERRWAARQAVAEAEATYYRHYDRLYLLRNYVAPTYKQELAQAERDVQLAAAALQQRREAAALVRQARDVEIQSAERDLAQAEAVLEQRRAMAPVLKQMRELEVQSAERRVAQLQRALEQRRALQPLLEQSRTFEIQSAEREVERAEQLLRVAQGLAHEASQVRELELAALEREVDAAQQAVQQARRLALSNEQAHQAELQALERDVQRAEQLLAQARQLDPQAQEVRQLQIRTLEREVAEAQASLEQAQALGAEAERARRIEIQALEREVAQAESDLARAQELRPESERLHQLELAVAEREVAELEAALRAGAGMVALLAPTDGTIGTLNVMPGGAVRADAPVLTIVTSAKASVVVTLGEHEVPLIAVGHEAVVTLPALGGKSFVGQVASITFAERRGDESPLYRVAILVEQMDAQALPGMTVQARIIASKKENVLLVPNSAIFTRDGKRYVQVERSGRAVDVEVQLGLRGESESEVISGLREGDRVILSNRAGPATSPTPAGQPPAAPGGSTPSARPAGAAAPTVTPTPTSQHP